MTKETYGTCVKCGQPILAGQLYSQGPDRHLTDEDCKVLADGMEVWIVGQMIDDSAGEDGEARIWEFGGVFTSEEKAIAACRFDEYFIAPHRLNEAQPHETVPMIGCYYPRLQSKEDALKA